MFSANSELLGQTNRVGVQFLLAEVETGITFLGVATTTLRDENRARNLQHAREVYFTVQRLLPRVTPLPEERQQIAGRMEELRRGLIKAGCSFEP